MNTLMFRSIMGIGFMTVAFAVLVGISFVCIAVQYVKNKDWPLSEGLFTGCVGVICVILGFWLAIFLIGWAAL